MDKETRQEYMREHWREYYSKNKDRINSKRRENTRRKALEAIENIEKLDDTRFLITDKNGNKYVIGNKD